MTPGSCPNTFGNGGENFPTHSEISITLTLKPDKTSEKKLQTNIPFEHKDSYKVS